VSSSPSVDFCKAVAYAAGVETFGQRVTRFREKLGITKAELAERAGFTPAYITTIEQGTRLKGGGKHQDAAQKLAAALGVGVDELTGQVASPVVPERRAGVSNVSALRLIFAALATRPAAQQLDVLRREKADRYHEMQPHLVDALEANIVLALRIAGVGASNSSTGRGRAKRKG
jgi:transcriptional regulator with XRE-family HTH domain